MTLLRMSALVCAVLVCSIGQLASARPTRAQSNSPGTEEVEVTGVAAIVNKNVAIARDRALDDAKRRAVEQVAGAHVSAQTITKNFQLVEDRVLSRAAGFVQAYRILSEGEDAGTYRIKMLASVDKKAVVKDLAVLFAEKPRVIVMIAEQNIGAKDFTYWWGNSGFVADLNLLETTLISAWQPRGYKFVDPAMLTDRLEVKGPMNKPGLSNDDALRIGRNADADVAVVGRVLISDAGPPMEGVNMHTYRAVATLRALNVDTGEIIAVADSTAARPNADPNLGGRSAIKALAGKILPSLEGKILERWTAEAASARDIEVVARGAKTSSMLREFTRVIREEIRGVESVHVRRRRKGRAFLTVRLRGTATQLGHDLETQTFKGFGIEVESISRAKITVDLRR